LDSEERHIIDEIKSGNDQIFENLFRDYYPRLTLHAFKLIGNQDQAEDIVQDFFVEMFDSRDKINVHTSLKQYLYQSVRNRCLNHIKHMGVHLNYQQKLPAYEHSKDPDPAELMAETELENRIAKIVAQLPKQCREIYLLSRQKGMKNKEIAETLNISVRTVETHISNALKVLRKQLSSLL
jgi:RNA polymerase sigma-70 factor (ECF subfamily)